MGWPQNYSGQITEMNNTLTDGAKYLSNITNLNQSLQNCNLASGNYFCVNKSLFGFFRMLTGERFGKIWNVH
jgi:hypothetical protein